MVNTNAEREAQTGTRIRLCFIRDINFPRFGVQKGEVLKCYREWGTGLDYMQAIETGEDRFPFAGGQCLLTDVKVLS
jgi:hypothetical protein